MFGKILLTLFILISFNFIFLNVNHLFEIKSCDCNQIILTKEREIELYIYKKSNYDYIVFNWIRGIIDYQQNENYKMIFSDSEIVLKECGDYFKIIDYFWKEKAIELGFENYCNSWKDNIDMGFYIHK